MSIKLLDELVFSHHKGETPGIPSVCSAHPAVLQAVMRFGTVNDLPVLVEATCNQVNQFGGYTGMTPQLFADFVYRLAGENKLPEDNLILGGDHLGPSVWQHEQADSAMAKSEQLVKDYVSAGFKKIHLDTSMKLGDDAPALPLGIETTARRTARLAKACEQAGLGLERSQMPRYVIGSEVPVPGGGRIHEGKLKVTDVEDVRQTLENTHKEFLDKNINAAWERVSAVVVQPGVEFGDDFIHIFEPVAAKDLSLFIEKERMVFEAHSTDYQSKESLRQLVHGHYSILKVGPALTFAYREAVFALAIIEDELIQPSARSNLAAVMEKLMLSDQKHWKGYYTGSEEEIADKRKFSRSDRIRYYWSHPEAKAAINTLINNLHEIKMPLTLLSQFLPRQFEQIQAARLENEPTALIFNKIEEVLKDYYSACGYQID